MPFMVRECDSPPATPGRCGWCPAKVGEEHAPECVTIKRSNKYRVYENGEYVGTYTCDDPASWDNAMCEFHKNDGSWCVDNALDFGWLSPAARVAVERHAAPPVEGAYLGPCACSAISMRILHRGEHEFQMERD